MRTLTPELLSKLEKNKFYRFFVDAPRPDHARLKREAAIFERWIAREHAKERRMVREAYAEVTRHGSHTESRMRENCTYGSMRGRAFPTGRPALLYTLLG